MKKMMIIWAAIIASASLLQAQDKPGGKIRKMNSAKVLDSYWKMQQWKVELNKASGSIKKEELEKIQ